MFFCTEKKIKKIDPIAKTNKHELHIYLLVLLELIYVLGMLYSNKNKQKTKMIQKTSDVTALLMMHFIGHDSIQKSVILQHFPQTN